MAYDEIRVVYELMDDMSTTFNQSVEQLQDTNQEMQMIATVMEDGALLGMGGDAFVEAIRGKLSPAIAKLTEKMDELNQDVQAAKQYAQEADKESSAQF